MMNDVGSSEEQWDDSPKSMKEKRGSFLMMIIMLSWISQGMAASGTLFMLLGGRQNLVDQIELMNKVISEGRIGNEFLTSLVDGTIGILEITIINFTQINLTNLLVLLIGSFSVLLMYRLKKIGFLLYLVYCISELYVYNYFYGELSATIISLFSTGLISLVFIIMYSVNLKRMTE